MAEYELVYEIKNLCRNNQMRDVFFEEVECDDPEEYLRGRMKGKTVEFSTEKGAGGSVTHPCGGGRADPEVRVHAGVTKISTCSRRINESWASFLKKFANYGLNLDGICDTIS